MPNNYERQAPRFGKDELPISSQPLRLFFKPCIFCAPVSEFFFKPLANIKALGYTGRDSLVLINT